MDNEYIEKYPYHLVEFRGPGRPSANKWIDIVASIYFKPEKASGQKDRKPKKIQVYFPPPPYTDETYADYNEGLENLSAPGEGWKLFTVKVKGRAENLSEANAKLSDLKTNENAWSLSDATPEECEAQAIAAIRRTKLLAKSQSMITQVGSQQLAAPSTSFTAPITLSDSPTNTVDDNAIFTYQLVDSAGITETGSLTHVSTHAVDGKQVDNREALTPCTTSTLNGKSLPRQRKGSMKNPKNCAKRSSDGKENTELLIMLVTEVQELRKDVKNLDDKVENLKRSVVNRSDIVKKDFIGTRHQLGEKFKYQFPLPTLEQFDRFNLELADPNSTLKKHFLVVLEECLDSKHSVTKSAINMLKMYIDKSVALQHVGSKLVNPKVEGTKPKERIMINTEFYKCMDLLIRNHRTVSNINTGLKDVSSAVGSHLSNAKAWPVDDAPVGYCPSKTGKSDESTSTAATQDSTQISQPKSVVKPILITVPHQSNLVLAGQSSPVSVEEIITEPPAKRTRSEMDPLSLASDGKSTYSLSSTENSNFDDVASSCNEDSDDSEFDPSELYASLTRNA
ncbi:hypothetical protein QAD02_018849 [Eretmocerus hayati]|uniref:Uncharacterized protein n=1 Tax=Eretmocerus hayati TaxID=131215 RepID=A0ACC2PHY7_9HYME|nr:hypothetical protein QAD02_018849 [Eretmocerus hayati]